MNQAITACAFLHHQGKLLIAKRASTKNFLPGKFELPGGHIEFGEDIAAGLKREILEELDVDVSVGDPFHAFTYLHGDMHVVEVDYFVTLVNPDSTITLNPADHSEFRWVTKADVDEVWDKTDDEYQAIIKGFELLDK